jgi:AraC family transcriptional regulator
MPTGSPIIPVSTGRPLVTCVAGPFTVTLMEHRGNVRLERHRHREAIVGLLLRGRYDERIDTRTVEPAAASLLVKPPETPHANTIGRDGTDTILIQIEPDRIPDEARRLLSDPGIRLDPRFFVIGQRLLDELRFGSGSDCRSLAITTLVTELLTVADMRSRAAGVGSSRRQQWISRVRERLHERTEGLALDELASEVGVDRAHLARTFRAVFGCTIGEYLRALRMERAARRLNHTDSTVAETAAELGFFDQAHFTREFRAAFGMAPGAWRRHIAR